MNALVVRLLLLLIVVISGNIMLVESHERAHREIFARFGVQSETVCGLTACRTKNVSPYPVEYFGEIQSAHALNEAFGYQLMAFFNGIALLSALFLLRSQGGEGDKCK